MTGVQSCALPICSAFRLREELLAVGAVVYGHDPYFSDEHLRKAGFEPYDLSQPIAVRGAIVQAPHAEYRSFNFAALPGLEVVVDGRNALDRDAIEAAGVAYLGIGR